MERGHVKLWRKSIDSGLFQSPNLWTFWCWCLVKATWKERSVVMNMQVVKLEPGQFVFGRIVASKELNMSERTIRTCIDKLKIMGNLSIKSTNKYSIITVINWDIYQETRPANDQQTTSKRPANDHIQEVKERKNKSKETPSFIYPEKYSDLLKSKFNDFIRNRTELKKPVTEIAFNSLVNKLEKLSCGDEKTSIEILENSIENGWAGIFEIKGKKPKQQLIFNLE